jgi:hypothetical protein
VERGPLTQRALNRALLARQGLLQRLDAPLVEVVEAIGAVQAQHWPAPPVALWSRAREFAVAGLYGALERGDLVVGTLLRATLHLVSAREHPAYAAAVAATGADDWRRTKAEPDPEVETLRARLLAYAADAPRTGEELAGFVEEWVAARPGAIDPGELEHQRGYKWRPFLRWSALVRAPGDGRWGPKAPAALRAAPWAVGAPAGAAALGPPAGAAAPDPDRAARGHPCPSRPTADEALDAVIRRHLRAFGPAAAEDVAYWIGWRVPPVRAALDRLDAELAHFADEDGRALHDLPDAPRPDPDVPAAVRLLAPFDSVLLAYAAGHRARILPDAHRDAVYERANLRIRPTFLVDGHVAGTWSIEVRRREAVLTLRPLEPLDRPTRAALVEEAEQLVRATQPAAKAHGVVVEG